MTQKEINEAYNKFKITQENIPTYTNPHEFASTFKQCSILQNVDTTYSSNIKKNS